MKNTKATANNIYVEKFKNALAMVKQKGVTTKDMLITPKFTNEYVALWYASQNYINFVALKSRTSKSSREALKADNKAPQYGNINMVQSLLEHRVYDDIYDIQMDALAKVMDSFESIIRQSSVDHMVFYTFTIVTNFLKTLCNKYIPKGFAVISLQQEIKSNESSSDDRPTTIEDTIGSIMDNPEDIFFAKETVAEKLQEKKQAFLDHRKEIVAQILELKCKRAQLLSLLYIDALNQKPSSLTHLLMENSHAIDEIESTVIADVCKKYSIDSTYIFTILDSTVPIDPHSFKLESQNPKIIAAEISRLKGRAKDAMKLKLKK